MEETISLKELMATLRKRMILILSLTVIAAVISGIMSFYILTPIYQASTQLLVNQSKDQQNGMYNMSEVQTNLQLINTYNVIMKSPVILEKVIENLDLDMTVSQLTSKINVASEKDSQVVNITVQDADAALAADIANGTALVFQKEIVNIMNVDNVSILSKAVVAEDPSPIKPKPLLNIAIAVVVGLMAGVGIAFLLEYLDNTIKTEQDVEKLLGLPVLGAISKIESDELNEEEIKANRRSRVKGGKVLGS
ncbi:YveK family protein [Falsibacillus pallidus]|uniref:Capsular polysaccharide biosynthesis protein n=1 Tax=Falsibacillus pallidus TaxID=493781 RepID=A0A370GCU6_9BACI|nr:Wzz/FepE/Etk N-terminal domain-containing protein [Falsibacillus pallidus]RDI41645.1 capsular polysaccharide biosynthesis protein [Falsibacillus pallidus]